VVRLLALALVLLAVPLADAASVRSVSTPGPVVALALDGRVAAFAEGVSNRDCDRVWLWNLQTRRVTKLGRTTPCVETSTGHGIASVAIASGRALWLHYTGGNTREWRLFTATRTSPRPRQLKLLFAEADERAPIVLGNGDSSRFGDLLPYAVDREVVILRSDGDRYFTWQAPARVVALSALFGKLAVASEGGIVTVLLRNGTVVGTEHFEGEVTAVKLSGDGVLAQIGSRLELRRNGTSRTFALPRGARLRDAISDRALFVAGGQIRQLSLATGAQRALGPGVDVDAQLSTVVIATGRRVTARLLP
jgi:hypothetical protein